MKQNLLGRQIPDSVERESLEDERLNLFHGNDSQASYLVDHELAPTKIHNKNNEKEIEYSINTTLVQYLFQSNISQYNYWHVILGCASIMVIYQSRKTAALVILAN